MRACGCWIRRLVKCGLEDRGRVKSGRGILLCATRRTESVRRKNPGRFAQNDRGRVGNASWLESHNITMLIRYFLIAAIFVGTLAGVGTSAEQKVVWKPVQFAIVRFNEDAPKSWNIYHGDKRGVLLVRLWKRFMLVDLKEQEVYEVDPEKVKAAGENVEWSPADIPDQPVETSEWKVRDVGLVQRVRFRFGKSGSFLEIQLPLLPNGKTAY